MKKDLIYRSLSLRLSSDGAPTTLNAENRSVEVVAATETPAKVWDWDRGLIDEILLMSGLEMPQSRQVPLLDTHSRWDTSSVIGSFREMVIEGDQLVGRSYFSSVSEADGPYTKVREGHLTDFSVGYRVLKAEWVPDGETSVIQGRSFKGPVKIVTKWQIKELSVCPIGADENAKARAEGHKPKVKENNQMNEKLRAVLEARGLSKDATEEEAWAFLEKLEMPKPDDQRSDPEPNEPKVDADKIRAEAIGEERDRIREIDAMCKRFECTDLADGFITKGISMDMARKAVMEHIAERDDVDVRYRPPAEIQADEKDKFRSAAQDALLIRSGIGVEKPAIGADDLTGYSLRELARHSLRLANQSTGGHPLEMIGRAMMTSDFPYILANTANKSLFIGWETAEETWQEWCGTGQVSDFKTHYSPRASETDDLDEIPENMPYKYGERTEAQEQYQIATYGKLFVITRQTIINDDLNALIDIPKAHGEAAARKVGDVAYAVLTANAAMGDGTALFHADHGNFVDNGSGAAPGVATIGAGILAMKTQKDLRGLRRLNIRPRFLIAPAALEGTAEVFFRSERFVDSDTVATDSSLAATRVNPYAGNYFTRVYEPRLDDDDAAAWYLAGPKGKTVVVFFLNGVQAPYMETKQGWSVDGVEYKVRIDCGAKAMDWRGLYMNDGN